jgi:hypothetical protein
MPPNSNHDPANVCWWGNMRKTLWFWMLMVVWSGCLVRIAQALADFWGVRQ